MAVNYTPDFRTPFQLPDGKILYAAFFRELPNCIAQGDSPGEALQALRELLPIVLDQMRATGQAIPEPLPPASTGARTETAGRGQIMHGVHTFAAAGQSTTPALYQAGAVYEPFGMDFADLLANLRNPTRIWATTSTGGPTLAFSQPRTLPRGDNQPCC